MNSDFDIPVGFGMALAQNTKAMTAFSYLSKEQQQNYIDKAKTVDSKNEMQNLVATLIN